MKVLVVGRGGREHALCVKIGESPLVSELFVSPGNPGLREVAQLLPWAEDDHTSLLDFAWEKGIDLVLIGPEQPLALGLTNRFQSAGIPVFAPTKEAAQIESSKSFAKDLMQKYGIPTAAYTVFSDYNRARAYLEACPVPVVLKADGLAAGKGVVVAQTRTEALSALREMLVERRFGEASEKIVIEEFLEGEEFSLMALVHGETVVPLEIAQDHKRAYDGDLGPNTGGMGAYSPVPQISPAVVSESLQTILIPAAKALVAEGCSFTGVLYAGLIAGASGPKVIEFNARFGDPETQVVLPRMQSDLVEVICQLLAGEKPEISWSKQAMLGVVVASAGYPEKGLSGVPLLGLDDFSDRVRIFYSGVATNKAGLYLTTGGRTFLAAATADNLEEAGLWVYEELAKLKGEGLFYRKDIGKKAKAASV